MNFVKIGHTKKTYGTKGEMKVFVEDAYVDDFLGASVVFLEIGGKKLPFFIEEIRESGDILVKFEDVDDKNTAVSFSSKKMFLRDTDLTVAPEEVTEMKYRYLEGFTLIDEESGEIGKIEAVYELPQQEMAEVTYQGKQVLIPLNEKLILQIDKKAGQVIMQLPDGLLSL